MNATWKKLRDDSWGILVKGAKPAISSGVEVHKGSGEKSVETISDVIWSSDDGQVHICKIVQRPKEPRGHAGASGGVCRGCRGPIVNAKHHRAMGGYCGNCAFDEYDM